MLLSDFTNNEPVWVSGRTYKVGDVVRSPGNWYFKYVRITNGAGTTDPFSDTGNWVPDGARPIKVTQRGVILFPPGSNGMDVTISPVVLGVTQLRLLGATGFTSATSPPIIYLNSPTNLRVQFSSINNSSCHISWEITEYHS